MPKRSRAKTSSRKTYKAKRSTVAVPSTSRPFATPRLFPMGNSRSFKLKYAAQIALAPGALGIVADHYFSCNGLYDPDITGVGHQPLGFDQLIPLYDHYLVTKATIKVWFTNKDAAQVEMCYIQLRDRTGAYPDLKTNIENGSCVYTMAATVGTGENCKYLGMTCDVGKFLGIKDISDYSSAKGTDAANPGEQCYFVVGCAPIQGVQPTKGTDAFIDITYEGSFVEPRQLVGS